MKALRKFLPLIIVIVLAACSAAPAKQGAVDELQASATPEKEASPSEEEGSEEEGAGVGVESIAKEVNPLTGLAVDAEQLNHRPVSVKITNYPRSARPQWGLTNADIVYEYYHNNELTRFHAIFYGEDAEMAGPIRSGRLFDDYLVDMYSSVLVFASADYRILDHLRSEHPIWQTVFLLEGSCPPRPVCRYSPSTSNHLLADTAEISKYSEELEGELDIPELSGMSFSTEPLSDGEAVDRINLRYSYSAYSFWDYEVETSLYRRYQDNGEDFDGTGESFRLLTDRNNGEAIEASNVVLLLMPHSFFYYRPASGSTPASEIVDMEFEGRGQAFAFRDGMAYQIEWINDGEQLLHFEDLEGNTFFLKPGTSWFQVMTDDSYFEVDGSRWRFHFVFPKP